MKKFLIIPILFILSCSTEPEDCAGVEGGTAYLDECGTCDIVLKDGDVFGDGVNIGFGIS